MPTLSAVVAEHPDVLSTIVCCLADGGPANVLPLASVCRWTCNAFAPSAEIDEPAPAAEHGHPWPSAAEHVDGSDAERLRPAHDGYVAQRAADRVEELELSLRPDAELRTRQAQSERAGERASERERLRVNSIRITCHTSLLTPDT